MYDPNPTPATGLHCIRISPDNVFAVRKAGEFADRLDLWGKVSASVEKILPAIGEKAGERYQSEWEAWARTAADKPGADVEKIRKKLQEEVAKIPNMIREGVDSLRMNLSADAMEMNGRILQCKFNRPPSGPHDEMIAVYAEGDRVGWVNAAYEEMVAGARKPETGAAPRAFKDVFNDPAEADPAGLPKSLQNLFAAAGADEAKRRRAARHYRALSPIWEAQDVERAVKSILGLTEGVVNRYVWCGKTRASGRVIISEAYGLALDAANNHGAYREMRDVTDEVRAWCREKGLEFEKDYWKYPLEEPRFRRKGDAAPMGDELKTAEGVNALHDQLKKDGEALSPDAKTLIRDLREIATVGDLAWNRSRKAQTLYRGDELVMANEAACQGLGYTAAELRFKSVEGSLWKTRGGILADAASHIALRESQCALAAGEAHRFLTYRMFDREGGVVTAREHAYGLGGGMVYRNTELKREKR